MEESLRIWLPEKHFCVTALTFIKKIFYMKSFDQFGSVANEDARRLFNNDKEAFLHAVNQCVQDSLSRIHDEQPPECTLRFTEPKPAHDLIRESILGKATPTEIGESNGAKEVHYDVSNEV